MPVEDNRPDEKSPSSVEPELPSYSEVPKAEYENEEKEPFLASNEQATAGVIKEMKQTHQLNKVKSFSRILCFLAFMVFGIYFYFDAISNGLGHFKFEFSCHRTQLKPLDHHPLFRNLIDVVDTSSSGGDDTKAKEIISVTNPFVPNPRYGKSLYSTQLVRHDFGNSWGKPAVVNFTAPSDISFDAVVVTLHTEVDGVQYDRLANLFVDGVQVWRTSTIEPGGRKTFSDVKKDVSKYSKLFKKKNVPILFQLDNLLTDTLTGVFDVTLSIDLFEFPRYGPQHHGGPHHGPRTAHHQEEAEPHTEEHNDEVNDDKEKRHYRGEGNGEHQRKKHHKGMHHKGDKHHKSHKDKDGKHSKPEEPKEPHHPPHRFFREHEIFSASKPADQIYPLTFNSKTNQPPVVYLGSGRLAVSLPSVSKNTTRLQLSIFTSGNAADEFWYANVIDKFTDIFADDGNRFIGRGPARAVNVYFNGKKIVTQTPEPVIFTGGISPALWSPVVSFNAFDVPSIDVDISGLLPSLWEHQAADDKLLEIEISNGLGEIGKDDSLSVNENWVTTANLLTFENDQVVESSGEVVNSESIGTGNVVAISPYFTRSFQQIVEVILKTQIISNIRLKLKDGRVLNTTLSTYWQAEIANVQNYGSSGDRQSVVHVGHSTQSFLIQDNDIPEFREKTLGKHKNVVPDNAIVSVNTSLSYPLVLNLNQFSKKLTDDDEFFVDFEVKLVHSKGVDVWFAGDRGSISTSASQNGKSRFLISSKGNHGVGATTSKYESQFKFGRHERDYKRAVEAVNGTIVSDETDTHEEGEKDNFYAAVQVVEHTSGHEGAVELSNKILKALHGGDHKGPCHAHGGLRGIRGNRGDVRHAGAH
ncbi:hypothetical protein Cantr_04058 [Candida viswanathii]|uniref:Peptide N-acetyl-beta-D-glucosaminyl asparaginase amidase A N-terminal domain-containing protein n=1 Tax=Candida viswanathii TaxID=5486 RepID=A0A367XNK4_9ASCO|nr:hypothetical protein Cantr_04058 [Candida viswanathii]